MIIVGRWNKQIPTSLFFAIFLTQCFWTGDNLVILCPQNPCYITLENSIFRIPFISGGRGQMVYRCNVKGCLVVSKTGATQGQFVGFSWWQGFMEWLFLAAAKQLYEWFSLSVHLSVCLSHLFLLCSHYHIIMEFSGVITNDRSDVYAKCQGQRPKVKVTEVKTQFSCFWTVTRVWIHICQWNDAQSFMWHRRGALMFFKVIHQISRSHITKNCRFWTRLVVLGQ